MKKNNRVGISRYVAPHPSYAWYIKTLGMFALLGGLVLGGAFWFYQQQMIRAIGLERLAGDPEALQDQALNLLVFNVSLSGLAFCGLILVVAAFYFHRVAGPVYRIKRHMLEILDGGQVGRLQLRQADQLQDVAEVYNALLARLGVIAEEPPPGP